jgi:CRP/FNR family cyclic AMP-dependent transcriptional regulator
MSSLQRFFKTGQFIFKDGDDSRSMFLIRKGTVAIQKVKGDRAIELARIHSNEVLGELSFFDRQPRSASAIALTDVELMEIPFEDLDKVYINVPDYLKTIIASVAERLRRANDTIRRLQKAQDDEPAPTMATLKAARDERKGSDES